MNAKTKEMGILKNHREKRKIKQMGKIINP